MRAFIIAAILITLVYFGYKFSGTGYSVLPEQMQEVMVTKIIDGDTIVIEGGQKLRLLGIDANERGKECYKEALDRLEQLILNKKVSLESEGDNKDRYNRLLRWIWLNDNLINMQIVAEGVAIARFEQPSKYQEQIAKAEKAAMENKIGCMWSSQ